MNIDSIEPVSDIDSSERKVNVKPNIVWNHRWEHDKNPEGFFEAIINLDRKGYDFKIIVLGQSFRDIPLLIQLYLHAVKEKYSPL